MKPHERLALLYKVADLYYRQGKKKYIIAQMVKQSPTQVGNLLREAQDEGIVQIKVNLPPLNVFQDHLKHKFHLRDVVVVPFDADCPSLLRRLSKAAAEYFETHVKDSSKVALGGGYLIHQMVNSLTDRRREIDIFPTAIIARGPNTAHIDPLVVVNSLWVRSGHLKERAHYVTVTPLDKRLTLKQVRKHYRDLLRNGSVKELYDSMKSVDWVFASIGGVDADREYIAATNYSTRNLLDEIQLDDATLRAQGVVGDVAYSFFDAEGSTRPEWNLVLSLGVEDLKQMSANTNKNVVVVVGHYKIDALRALLHGNICNTLITDSHAAELLLKTQKA